MATTSVDILAHHESVSIVQLPERKFPAVTIQGDSFSIIVKLARTVAGQAARTSDTKLIDDTAELRERLDEILQAYEKTLGERGIPLPY